jgi:UDP-2,3-diacylglucosamine hydrolase
VSSTLFISDLHLDSARPQLSEALAALLERHCDCDALYILGDLFETWIGDDDDSTIAADTCALLRQFSDRGPALFLMPGNRDFLIGEDFCARAGATLLTDPTVIDLYKQRTLLMHGDSLCTADTEYQAFRERARDPLWQSQMLNFSLQERRAVAARLRSISGEAKSNKAEDIVDVTPAEVERVMTEQQVQQLIHGHTHRPARHETSGRLRLALGDWGDDGWLVSASAGTIDLTNFNI